MAGLNEDDASLSGKLGLSDAVMDCVRGGETFEIIVRTTNNSQSYHLHEKLLFHSKYLSEKVDNIRRYPGAWAKKIDLGRFSIEPAVFELFIQWLYTGSYQENDEKVASFAVDPSLNGAVKERGAWVTWNFKAGVLTWFLGMKLEAPGFQNYTMFRILHEVNQVNRSCRLHAKDMWWILNLTGLGYYKPLHRLFEDLIIKNWGVSAVIDDKDEGWKRLLDWDDDFRRRFNEALALPSVQRQKATLNMNDYFETVPPSL